MIKSNQHLLERLKGLEISQIDLFAKEWQAWLETLSQEDLEAYLSESQAYSLLLGVSMKELELEKELEERSLLGFQHHIVMLFSMLAVWQARKLKELKHHLGVLKDSKQEGQNQAGIGHKEARW